jgi:DNA-binding CsgD family transcriptional regulator
MDGVRQPTRSARAGRDAAGGEEARRASTRLPKRQREVLTLRGHDGLSYREIATRMELSRDAVAQLIARARINLYDELRGTALASVVPSQECERALPLIAAREDGELAAAGDDAADGAWLDAHLAGCDRCRLAAEQMREASVACSGWAPIVATPRLGKARIEPATDGEGSSRRGALRGRRLVLAVVVVALLLGGVVAALAARSENQAPAGSTMRATAERGIGEQAHGAKNAKGGGDGGVAKKQAKQTGRRGEAAAVDTAARQGAAGDAAASPVVSPLPSDSGGAQAAGPSRPSAKTGVGATERTSVPKAGSKRNPAPTPTQASQPTPAPTQAPPPEQPQDEPGHSGEASGHSGEAPGHNKAPPGQSK